MNDVIYLLVRMVNFSSVPLKTLVLPLMLVALGYLSNLCGGPEKVLLFIQTGDAMKGRR